MCIEYFINLFTVLLKNEAIFFAVDFLGQLLKILKEIARIGILWSSGNVGANLSDFVQQLFAMLF